MLFILALGLLLAASSGANAYLYVERRRLLRDKKTPTWTYDAEQLLHDLTNGTGLVKIERLGTMDYFLRSPRG